MDISLCVTQLLGSKGQECQQRLGQKRNFCLNGDFRAERQHRTNFLCFFCVSLRQGSSAVHRGYHRNASWQSFFSSSLLLLLHVTITVCIFQKTVEESKQDFETIMLNQIDLLHMETISSNHYDKGWHNKMSLTFFFFFSSSQVFPDK